MGDFYKAHDWLINPTASSDSKLYYLTKRAKIKESASLI